MKTKEETLKEIYEKELMEDAFIVDTLWEELVSDDDWLKVSTKAMKAHAEHAIDNVFNKLQLKESDLLIRKKICAILDEVKKEL